MLQGCRVGEFLSCDREHGWGQIDADNVEAGGLLEGGVQQGAGAAADIKQRLSGLQITLGEGKAEAASNIVSPALIIGSGLAAVIGLDGVVIHSRFAGPEWRNRGNRHRGHRG